jgi:hypothetical protein
MLPLGKGYPIREAEYLWGRYTGQEKGPGKRLQTYGRYAKAVSVRPRDLEPMPWHWTAWPAEFHQGGVCGTMTTVASGTYTSLGVPVMKSGQPGHSCIVKYNHVKGFYMPVVSQSVSGMFNTTTGWLFADDEGYSVNFFEHMALALAVNIGLDKYMDTRIAVNLYKVLAQHDQAQLGYALVMDTASRNPYNPRTFRILMKGSPEATMAGIDLLKKYVAESKDDFIPWKERNVDEDLGDDDENEKTQLALPEGWRIGKYREMMLAELGRRVVKTPIPNLTTAKRYYPWFDRQVQANDLRFVAKRQECLRQIKGATGCRIECERAIAGHVRQLGKEPRARDLAIWKASIDQVLRDLPSARSRAGWLVQQERLFPKDKLQYNKTVTTGKGRRKKTKVVVTTDPVYTHLTQHMEKLRDANAAKPPPAGAKKG